MSISENDFVETEIDTGRKWVDGKKIYRKCYDLTGSWSTAIVILDSTLTISYIDSLVYLSGMGHITENKWLQSGYSSTHPRLVFQISTSGLIYSDSSSDLIYDKFKIIVEYTKA